MKNVYFYPNSKRLNDVVVNPYIEDMMFVLSKNYRIINAGNPSNSGIIQFFVYLRRTDFLVLNWIEDLPDKKFGRLQVYALILQLMILKMLNKKIVWVLHNKLSHYPGNRELKNRLQMKLAKWSDFILTHTEEGLNYLQFFYPEFKAKVLVVQHPVKENIVRMDSKPAYDVIIWGSLLRYKGIHKFLKYLYEQKLEDDLKFL
jgi:beta-1,4-mannosyltransferase